MKIIRDTQRLKDFGALFLFLLDPKTPFAGADVNVLVADRLPAELKAELLPLVPEIKAAIENQLDLPDTAMALSKVAQTLADYCFRGMNACVEGAKVGAQEAELLARAKAHPEAFALVKSEYVVYWEELITARARIQGSVAPTREWWRTAAGEFGVAKQRVDEDADVKTVYVAFLRALRSYCYAESFSDIAFDDYLNIDHCVISLNGYLDYAIEALARQKVIAAKVEEIEKMGGQGSHEEILSRVQAGYQHDGHWDEAVIMPPQDDYKHSAPEYSSYDYSYDYIPDFNPASGLPMIDNSCIDVGGHAYGTNDFSN